MLSGTCSSDVAGAVVSYMDLWSTCNTCKKSSWEIYWLLLNKQPNSNLTENVTLNEVKLFLCVHTAINADNWFKLFSQRQRRALYWKNPAKYYEQHKLLLLHERSEVPALKTDVSTRARAQQSDLLCHDQSEVLAFGTNKLKCSLRHEHIPIAPL